MTLRLEIQRNETTNQIIIGYMGVSENVVYPIVPTGFADHCPVFKWLFHWEYNPTFSDKPIYPLVIKRGLLESPSFIVDFPLQPSI